MSDNTAVSAAVKTERRPAAGGGCRMDKLYSFWCFQILLSEIVARHVCEVVSMKGMRVASGSVRAVCVYGTCLVSVRDA